VPSEESATVKDVQDRHTGARRGLRTPARRLRALVATALCFPPATFVSSIERLGLARDKTADGNPETGMNMMKDYIANVSDLRGVFVTDPIMTQVVGQAVAEKKSDDKINIIGVGSDEKLVKYLQDNTISALIVEDPYRLGYMSVKTALSASRGEQVAALGSVEAALVTKVNLSSSHSQELLHPKVK
jgi:ribose transport system substrate-binding protein